MKGMRYRSIGQGACRAIPGLMFACIVFCLVMLLVSQRINMNEDATPAGQAVWFERRLQQATGNSNDRGFRIISCIGLGHVANRSTLEPRTNCVSR